MTGKRKREPRNVAASVHQRLLNLARESGTAFNALLQRFAMERILYRLSRSPHAENFVLKGALMFVAWDAPLDRPTLDIDLLGHVTGDPDKQTQWSGFLRRNRLDDAPKDFRTVVARVCDFLGPVCEATSAGERFRRTWKTAGHWA